MEHLFILSRFLQYHWPHPLVPPSSRLGSSSSMLVLQSLSRHSPLSSARQPPSPLEGPSSSVDYHRPSPVLHPHNILVDCLVAEGSCTLQNEVEGLKMMEAMSIPEQDLSICKLRQLGIKRLFEQIILLILLSYT